MKEMKDWQDRQPRAKPYDRKGIIELPVKPRNTAKLPPPPAEPEQREVKQLPARAASKYAASINRKRGRFGLPWWLWPAK